VSPISPKAHLSFEIDMNLLHSCKVRSEDSDEYHVESITNHRFSVKKNNDSNWRIEK
jgi:hypothetical protein